MQVALFFQKAARSARLPVVWDYHVILLLQPKDLNLARVVREPGIGESLEGGPPAQNRAGSYVYDLDSYLPSPCPWEDYLELTFPSSLLPEYQSSFRVISAKIYLDSFVSDRSHMLVKNARELEDGQVELDDEDMPHDEKPDIGSKVAFSTLSYSAEPPSYEPLCGALMAGSGIGSNLMSHFVCMEATPGSFGEVIEWQEIRSRF
ncbi:hypothetical protein D9611_004287 [Ephemerocybe angulata]|uniref:Protein N-terminal glutamine amidohydrolase n=1 Tax=Ephemerocybe angulata TaxID=980116 RepID=A0A8H5BLS6_9AGAR|nr:hypothetical protein D9611_004287 [Tulosesus angulatus]